MSEVEVNGSFPLDDDGFLRRKCPLCCKEFKVLLEEEERTDLIQKSIDSFMIEPREERSDVEQSEYLENEFVCPYCGQRACKESWLTQEQFAYIGVIVKNIVARWTNENFVRPLKRQFRGSSSGSVSIRFEAKEMEQQEPWISPEVNDMEIFNLPCCQRKIKIEENRPDVIYCFFCGFPHKCKNRESKGI